MSLVRVESDRLIKNTSKGKIEPNAESIGYATRKIERSIAEDEAAGNAIMAGHTSETSPLVAERDPDYQGKKYRNDFAKKAVSGVLGIVAVGAAIAALASGLGSIALGPLLIATGVLSGAGAIAGSIYGESYGRKQATRKQNEPYVLTQSKARLVDGYEESLDDKLLDRNYNISRSNLSEGKKQGEIDKNVEGVLSQNRSRTSKAMDLAAKSYSDKGINTNAKNFSQIHNDRPRREIVGGRLP